MLTSDSAITALGGTTVVAKHFGVPLSTVSTWRARGIPPRRWADFVRLAGEVGCEEVTFEALAELQSETVRT